MTGLAGRLLAVAVETLLDVLHDLQLQLLSEVELSKYLLLPPNWSGPLLIVELVLDSSRLESLDPHVVQPDYLDRFCPLQLNDLVIHLLHLVCPAISNSARQIFLCSDSLIMVIKFRIYPKFKKVQIILGVFMGQSIEEGEGYPQFCKRPN